jgi:hypothetical protein
MSAGAASGECGLQRQHLDRRTAPIKRITVAVALAALLAAAAPAAAKEKNGGGEAAETARSNGIFAGRDRRTRLTHENLS